jgi:type II secretory pathway pseudopilin PulG
MVYKQKPRGFTYVGILLAIAIMGFFVAAVSEVWHTAAKREREAELLFAGGQIRQALTRYAASAPGGERYPRRLEDLLRDPRYPVPRRYLRQVYRDPMTPSGEWGLVTTGDFIVGVHSLSEEEPLKTAGFDFADRAFEDKKKYSEWVFMMVDTRAVRAPAATKTAPAAASRTPAASSTTPAASSPLPGTLAQPRSAPRQQRPPNSRAR